MKQLKILLLISIVVLFTACGDSSSSTEVPVDTQSEAISKIMLYADDDTQPALTILTYETAGVKGVTLENIDDVNGVVASLTASDVDTTEKIQKIVIDLGINIPPSINAGADKAVNIYQAVTITGVGSDVDGTIVSYEWTKGTATLAVTASFDYTPTTMGTDTLTLTVMDDDGATASDSMNVVVTPVSFASDVMPIFEANCAGCHTTSGSRTFKVGDAAFTYGNIATNNLIDTQSPDLSRILIKGDGGESHGGGVKLSDVESAIVREWIVEGGLND